MRNHKQILMKSEIFFKEPPMVYMKPGMWWNLDIFGKFALEIRMDYWYLWKTHFLNFRDFQESPNPLKIPIPTPASDFCTRCVMT